MEGDLGASDLLRVDVEIDGSDTVLVLSGELDVSSRRAFWAGIERGLDAGGDVVVDVASLRFVDASGLRAFLEAQRLLGERFALRCPSAAVRRLLEVTGTDRHVRLRPVESKVEYVRRLWDAYQHGGPAAMAELVPDEVDWVPWVGGGRPLHGSRELREFWASRGAPHSRIIELRQIGSDVLVRVELSLASGELKELWSIFHFDGDVLVRAASFENPRDALDSAA